MRIVDIHIHPWHQVSSLVTPAVMAEIHCQQMDLAGVAVSGILGKVSPGQTPEQVIAGNDYTRATVAAYPGRLYGLCYIDPTHPSGFVRKELDRCLSQPEFRGIKLEIDVCCRDKRLNRVMEKAGEYGVPVLHHSWYINLWSQNEAMHKLQAGRSEAHDIADLARRFPDIAIVMAHLEGSGIRGVLDVADCPNVVIDTSGSQPFTGTLEYAVRKIGAGRILYGSDLYGRSSAAQLGRVLGAGLSRAALKQILYANADKLYKLGALGGEESNERKN